MLTRTAQYTVNGKKIEVAVKRIINGDPAPMNLGAMANPASLELFRNIDALRLPPQ